MRVRVQYVPKRGLPPGGGAGGRGSCGGERGVGVVILVVRCDWLQPERGQAASSGLVGRGACSGGAGVGGGVCGSTHSSVLVLTRVHTLWKGTNVLEVVRRNEKNSTTVFSEMTNAGGTWSQSSTQLIHFTPSAPLTNASTKSTTSAAASTCT